jgi:hypothetical protein
MQLANLLHIARYRATFQLLCICRLQSGRLNLPDTKVDISVIGNPQKT